MKLLKCEYDIGDNFSLNIINVNHNNFDIRNTEIETIKQCGACYFYKNNRYYVIFDVEKKYNDICYDCGDLESSIKSIIKSSLFKKFIRKEKIKRLLI